MTPTAPPRVLPHHTLELRHEHVVFAHRSRRLWVLTPHALLAYDPDERTQRVTWSDDSTYYSSVCVDPDDGSIFLLGRRGDETLVVVELDATGTTSLARREHSVHDLMDRERADIFVSDDLFMAEKSRVFRLGSTRHVIARCGDECGEFFVHWPMTRGADPMLVALSFDDGYDLSLLEGGSCVVVDGLLYDLVDRCVVMRRAQRLSPLARAPGGEAALSYVDNEKGREIALHWSGEHGRPHDDVTLEGISSEDESCTMPGDAIALSRDARWLVYLDVCHYRRPDGAPGRTGHVGIWDTETGALAHEWYTESIDEFRLRLALSHDQRLVCVSYDGALELFELELPDDAPSEEWTGGVRRRDDYDRTVRHDAREVPTEWSPCPLSDEAILALDALGATYTGAGKPTRSHSPPAGIVWIVGETGERWSDEDPRGEFEVIAPPVWCITEHIEWPEAPLSIRDPSLGERVGVEMIAGTLEQFDCVVDGRRRLIQPIAFDDNQFYYGVDLLERSSDVEVFSFDHGAADDVSVAFHQFEWFAAALARATEE